MYRPSLPGRMAVLALVSATGVVMAAGGAFATSTSVKKAPANSFTLTGGLTGTMIGTGCSGFSVDGTFTISFIVGYRGHPDHWSVAIQTGKAQGTYKTTAHGPGEVYVTESGATGKVVQQWKSSSGTETWTSGSSGRINSVLVPTKTKGAAVHISGAFACS
jgi:hypothetical protein